MNDCIDRVFQGLAIVVTAFALNSCGGGGGAEDEYRGAAPLSLNGVTFDFGNARITLTAPSPNGVESGVETGGIVYERGSDTSIAFAPSSPGALDAQELTWPEDLGAETRYEYTHIDDNRGQLLVFANNLETDAFMYHPTDEGRFDVFSVEFISNGSGVSEANVVLTTWAPDDERYTTTIRAGLEIGGLTDSPQDLPLGWDGVNRGPGFIAPPTFNGLVMTMTEDGTGDQIQLANFIPLGGDNRLDDRSQETGTCSVIVTLDPLGTPTVTTYSANYTHEQIYGTEIVVFSVVYVSAGGGGSLPTDETFTFTFLGGESLTAGTTFVPVRTGEYVSSERPSGLFVLDNRATATE